MTEGVITIYVAILTYVIMLGAYFLSKSRRLHMSVMIGVMLFDLLIPIYLFMNRDWYSRLIDHEDILTFGVWMHFMLVIVLYILYVFQIAAGRKMLRDEEMATSRLEHRGQAKGILLVRAFVIFTGALLYDSQYLLK
jgi:hypothetical protein